MEIANELMADGIALENIISALISMTYKNEVIDIEEEEKVKSYDKKVKELISLGKKPTPKEVCSDCKWYYICKNIE